MTTSDRHNALAAWLEAEATLWKDGQPAETVMLLREAAATLRSVAAASLSDDERKALKFVADHCYGFLNARNIVYALLQRTERLSAAEPKCDTCGQVADGQAGEYPCAKCGRPTLPAAPDEPKRCEHGSVRLSADPELHPGLAPDGEVPQTFDEWWAWFDPDGLLDKETAREGWNAAFRTINHIPEH